MVRTAKLLRKLRPFLNKTSLAKSYSEPANPDLLVNLPRSLGLWEQIPSISCKVGSPLLMMPSMRGKRLKVGDKSDNLFLIVDRIKSSFLVIITIVNHFVGVLYSYTAQYG